MNITQKATEEDVINFFEAIILYALKDLDKMLECVNYNNIHQRLAVPIALTCFSLLDIIGFLIRDLDSEQLESKNNLSKENNEKIHWVIQKQISNVL